ncbi:MAG TPA: hypothetical protein VK327_09615, partial [Candidatus Paceibacterota bacterium]|nr:hypothetical protein [Candidatus Paceibacterota bacterium]
MMYHGSATQSSQPGNDGCPSVPQLGNAPEISSSSHAAEVSLTFAPAANETLSDLMNRIAGSLASGKLAVAAMFAFAPVENQPSICAAMRQALGEINWPVLWVEGKPCDDA